MRTIGILLAAGQSQRFGSDDKLLATLHGRPLVDHAAAALRLSELDELVAVVALDDVRDRLQGFQCVALSEKGLPQSESLRAGILKAQNMAADRALVVLADMPLVTPGLINDVLDLAGQERISATSDGRRRTPPACFPKSAFDDLLAMTGDSGASVILRALPNAQLVEVSEDALRDVDVTQDLRDLASQDRA